MTITTLGIDLAKNVIAVHGVAQNGNTALIKSRLARTALPWLIAGLTLCVIGMESCSGAHYWARLCRYYDHEPRLMAAKFVFPYHMAGKSGKNDAADAQSICEAVRRPHMRFAPVKDESQQAMQCLYRTRQGFIEDKNKVLMPCDTWFLHRRILYRVRFSNVLIICWIALLASKST